MSNPIPGFYTIRWIAPQSAADGIYSWNPHYEAYKVWRDAGRPAYGTSEFFAALPDSMFYANIGARWDAFMEMDAEIPLVAAGEVGYYAEANNQLAAQGINTAFRGAKPVRYLAGANARESGLDPAKEYMLIHQTDPREKGSGNRLQTFALYVREGNNAVPIYASPAFEGESPNTSNRNLALMFAAAVTFTVAGTYLTAEAVAPTELASESVSADFAAESFGESIGDVALGGLDSAPLDLGFGEYGVLEEGVGAALVETPGSGFGSYLIEQGTGIARNYVIGQIRDAITPRPNNPARVTPSSARPPSATRPGMVQGSAGQMLPTGVQANSGLNVALIIGIVVIAALLLKGKTNV